MYIYIIAIIVVIATHRRRRRDRWWYTTIHKYYSLQLNNAHSKDKSIKEDYENDVEMLLVEQARKQLQKNTTTLDEFDTTLDDDDTKTKQIKDAKKHKQLKLEKAKSIISYIVKPFCWHIIIFSPVFFKRQQYK